MKAYKGYPQELLELNKHKKRLQEMISYIDRRIDHVHRQVIKKATVESEERKKQSQEV